MILALKGLRSRSSPRTARRQTPAADPGRRHRRRRQPRPRPLSARAL